MRMCFSNGVCHSIYAYILKIEMRFIVKKNYFKIHSKLNWFDQLNFLVQLGRPAELLSWTSARLVFTRKPPGWNRLNRCPGPVEPVWCSLSRWRPSVWPFDWPRQPPFSDAFSDCASTFFRRQINFCSTFFSNFCSTFSVTFAALFHSTFAALFQSFFLSRQVTFSERVNCLFTFSAVPFQLYFCRLLLFHLVCDQ
jgi:ABC-type glycerol-3-phosphate transport system permease component